MKRFIFLLLLSCATCASLAQQYDFIIDRYASPYIGTKLNTSIYNAYKELDDIYLASSEGKQTFWWGLARLGKIIFMDGILSSYAMIAQHEFFGHGYRGREFGISGIGYKIAVTHGVTYFPIAQYNRLTYIQQAAISTGGMEATTILSQNVRQQWFLEQRIDRRDAELFVVSAMDQPNYIFGAKRDRTSVGNDVHAYIQEVNSWHGNTALSLHRLRKMAWWDMLDFTIYNAYYSICKYIIEGAFTSQLFMFEIQDYKYLPTTRTLLAPWGPEFQLQNHIVTPKHALWQVNLRYGRNSFINSFGIDVHMQPVYTYENFTFGNKFYLWRQPSLKYGSAAATKNIFGAADFVSVEYPVNKTFMWLGELGYKTAGFIQGDPLASSIVIRLGFRLCS